MLLAIGTSNFRKLNVPGEDLNGVIQALPLFREIRMGQAPELSGRVIVIGGGNVAVDAAMSARRLGADDVTLVCLESEGEMPAHDWEMEQAAAEGVKIKTGWGPAKFVGENGRFNKIRFKRCTRVFDEKNRFDPQYNESDILDIDADFAIIAIGQQVDLGGIEREVELETGPEGTFVVDPQTLQTDLPGVYAAGDAVSGPASVLEAIASGRKAADSIDRALGGLGVEREPEPDEIRDDPYLGRDEEFHRRRIARPVHLDPRQRIKDFNIIEQGFSPDNAQSMALACLRCNLRATITPIVLPPDKWQPLTPKAVQKIPSTEGVYQIADAEKKVTKIVGTADIRAGLEEECEKQSEGSLFCWEEDRMYSKRESELIQQHLQQYGEMPGVGADDLDDLF